MATQTVISTYAPPRSLFLSLQAPGQGGPFALEAKFKADPDVRKVNLIIGAYRDDEAQPWALSSVTEVSLNTANTGDQPAELTDSSKG